MAKIGNSYTDNTMPEIISHMICAPEFDGIGRVIDLHVATGGWVPCDSKLVTVAWEGGEAVVHAPDEGYVSSLLVAVGAELSSGELLLLMEIEEKETGWLPVDLAPACVISMPPAVPQTLAETDNIMQVSRSAASLAARLGVDLTEVTPGMSGVIDEIDIERHVRDRLARF